MMDLTEFFDSLVPQYKCITIIGTGGKTSLMELLASHHNRKYPAAKILVTTSTHIRLPASRIESVSFFTGDVTSIKAGVTYAGIPESNTQKLAGLPLAELNALVKHFDYSLIEGDGSRTKPLKGWAAWEPVIPECTEVTVGLIPLYPIGKPITEELVHRLPLFLKLCDAKAYDIITTDHYKKIIFGKQNNEKGLFHNTTNSILFFNQVEDEQTLELAKKITALISNELQKNITHIIAGSVKMNRVFSLYQAA